MRSRNDGSSTKKPNFFIVGAPRCGTTSLYSYLRAHPKIFMSRNKEPSFFSEDLPHRGRITILQPYLELFREATDDHLAIGECSVTYLYSYVAVERILAFAPGAKLIVMVRNPIDMIYSIHRELCYNFMEVEEDFVKAWRLQSLRKGWMKVPKWCLTPRFLQYEQMGKLGAQLERLLEVCPRDQVKIIVHDDFVNATVEVYENVLAFLGVPSDGRKELPRFNASRGHRSGTVGRLMMRAGHWSVRSGLGWRLRNFARRIGIRKPAVSLVNATVKTEARPPLSSEFRNELADVFRDDVAKISELLGRDLSQWTVRATHENALDSKV